MEKVRVGRIQYINVAPVYHGIDGSNPPFTVVPGSPSTLNRMVLDGELDVSPVSSVAYARHHDRLVVVPGLSISCFGRVMSVLLASQSPLDELDGKKIAVTDESETAACFLKLYFSQKGITPLFVETVACPCKELADRGFDSALAIGDLALTQNWEGCFRYVWDVGEMWQELATLPFVFALWVVRKEFAEKHADKVSEVVRYLHDSKRKGMSETDKVAQRSAATLGLPIETCRKYYSLLSYDLGQSEIEGVETFFDMLYSRGILPGRVRLSFCRCDF
ncbi:MAG: ABC transporter substrate-binding protein [Deltaproteobacteria bacterium]|nr:MAG: ABC transporter substrate-binding protein [Deltaproteobacteria bacterium]